MNTQRENTREKQLLYHVGSISRLMINNHMRDDLSAFVLHELCSKNGFGLQKAAYFVNNPDFQCLKGVGGYYIAEAFNGTSWEHDQDFMKHMEKALFHNKIRQYQTKHIKNLTSKSSLDQLQDQFEFEHPEAQVWNLKHDNQGIFLFDKKDNATLVDDHLVDFVNYLGFCQVY